VPVSCSVFCIRHRHTGRNRQHRNVGHPLFTPPGTAQIISNALLFRGRYPANGHRCPGVKTTAAPAAAGFESGSRRDLFVFAFLFASIGKIEGITRSTPVIWEWLAFVSLMFWLISHSAVLGRKAAH